MAQLPIHRLRLFKQGIAYYERRGVVDGTTTSLVIPRESTNDALKSLNLVINHGGPILSVDYETPEDKERLLNELPIKITERTGMVDLFNSLRGSRVALQLNNGKDVEGRVIGVEVPTTAEQMPLLILQGETDNTQIRIVTINTIQNVTLQDDRTTKDINFFLDVSQTEQTRTTLTVRLGEGQHDLSMSYLAPSPKWRVGYRIISHENGQAQLIGWGLFDNTLDEDLDAVSLTLVSGRPISFEYGLVESRTPSRPKVSDDPVGSETGTTDPRLAEALSAISHDLRTPLSVLSSSAELLQRMGSLTDQQLRMVQNIRQNTTRMNDLINSLLSFVRLKEDNKESNSSPTGFSYQSGPLGDLKVSSSYFMPLMIGNADPEYLTYEVQTPVSVRRGQSALVPIIDANLSYEELCVYNGDKMPNHPLRVWHLQNTTGRALEQGPITFINNETYLGEGLLRFTGADDDIQLPFALEFGILVAEDLEVSEKELFSIAFDSQQQQAIVSRYQITSYLYNLTSRIGRDLNVLIERRDPNDGEYFEMSSPISQQAGHTRWPIAVAAHQQASFTVRIREVYESKEDVATWGEKFIADIYAANLIPANNHQLLQSWLQEKQQAAEKTDNIKILQSEYAAIVTLQEQLRKNLDALGQSERELVIRNRVLDDLEVSENRRREIETLTTNLNSQIKQSQQRQNDLLRQIYGATA